MYGERIHVWVGGVVLVALTALLLVPLEPAALRAQGFVRILERDRERTGSPDATGSFFATLETWSGTGSLALRDTWRLPDPAGAAAADRAAGEEGAGLETEALRRSLRSQLAIWNASRPGRTPAGSVRLEGDSEALADATADLRVELRERGPALEVVLRLRRGSEREEIGPLTWLAPSRLALAPPLLAVLAALLLGRPVLALLAGVAVGAALLRAEAGATWLAVPLGLLDVGRVYLWSEVTDAFRFEIVALVLALVATIGVLQVSGAIDALIDRLARVARTARATLGLSFGLGLLLFFDDYANCLIVGNAMRPLVDRARVAREKLAFVVDSTAAPVAGLSLVSTWIAFEVSLYAPHLASAGFAESAYGVFVQSLPYRFYSIFALGLVLLCIVLQRDFGPMLRARPAPLESSLGALHKPGAGRGPGARAGRAWHALVCLGAVIVVMAAEILRRGAGVFEDPSRDTSSAWELAVRVLSESGGTGPLLTGALAGLGLALFLSASASLRAVALAALGGAAASDLLDLPVAWGALAIGSAALLAVRVRPVPSQRAFVPGARLLRICLAAGRRLLGPLGILLGAWMIAAVCRDARTADLLVALVGGERSGAELPVLLFTAAAGISFATGTSWGTMALLLPNVVPLAASVGAEHPLGAQGMVLVSIGAVLEGAIFGDHCSPISDTTILSSLASGSDHVAHVRTQLPYACSAALIAVAAGYAPILWAAPRWSVPASLVVGATALLGLLIVLGRRSDQNAGVSSLP